MRAGRNTIALIWVAASKPLSGFPLFYALIVGFLAGLTATPLRVAIVGIALGLGVFAILFVYVPLRPVSWRQTFARFTSRRGPPAQLEGW